MTLIAYAAKSLQIALTAWIRTSTSDYLGCRPSSTQQRPVVYIGQDCSVLDLLDGVVKLPQGDVGPWGGFVQLGACREQLSSYAG